MIEDKKYVLVLNMGLRSIRSIIFDDTGRIRAHSWLPVRTFIQGDKVEQDTSEWWGLAKRVIKESLEKEELRKNVGYITTTSSSANLVILDSEKKALYNSIMVSDKRAMEQSINLSKESALQYLFQRPNIQSVPSFLIPKILWLKEKEQKIFKKSRYFIPSDSFFLMKFSGKIVSDPHNAEKAFFDIESGSYPERVLSILGIDESYLPSVKPIGYNLGMITSFFSEEVGLSKEVKVIQTTYDALAAFWGSGANKEGDASQVSGTCSSLRVISSKKMKKNSFGLLSQYFPHVGSYIHGGSNNLGGGLLEWAKSTFYSDLSNNSDDYIFQIMEEDSKKSGLGSNGLVFLPYLLGERVPFFDSDVRGIFFGMERSHSRRDIMRSIFEAIGFLSQDLVVALNESGVDINQITMSGGLAKNRFVSQLIADITGKRIRLLDEAETTSLGCFILVAHSLNQNLNPSKTAGLVKIKEEFVPEEKNHKKYLKLYSFFKRLYISNIDNFKYLRTLKKDIINIEYQKINNL